MKTKSFLLSAIVLGALATGCNKQDGIIGDAGLNSSTETPTLRTMDKTIYGITTTYAGTSQVSQVNVTNGSPSNSRPIRNSINGDHMTGVIGMSKNPASNQVVFVTHISGSTTLWTGDFTVSPSFVDIHQQGSQTGTMLGDIEHDPVSGNLYGVWYSGADGYLVRIDNLGVSSGSFTAVNLGKLNTSSGMGAESNPRYGIACDPLGNCNVISLKTQKRGVFTPPSTPVTNITISTLIDGLPSTADYAVANEGSTVYVPGTSGTSYMYSSWKAQTTTTSSPVDYFYQWTASTPPYQYRGAYTYPDMTYGPGLTIPK